MAKIVKDVSSRDIMIRLNAYFMNFLHMAISQFSQFFLSKNGSTLQGVPSINILSCVKLQISYLRLTMKANFQSPYT